MLNFLTFIFGIFGFGICYAEKIEPYFLENCPYIQLTGKVEHSTYRVRRIMKVLATEISLPNDGLSNLAKHLKSIYVKAVFLKLYLKIINRLLKIGKIMLIPSNYQQVANSKKSLQNDKIKN